MKMYYTFGSDERYPFRGGWVEIEAPSVAAAHRAFRALYPDRDPDIALLNCADYYSESTFASTGMAQAGNLGAFCHRKIRYDDLFGEKNFTAQARRAGEPVAKFV